MMVILEDEAREVRMLALQVVQELSLVTGDQARVLTVLYDMCGDENDQVRIKAVQSLVRVQGRADFTGQETSIVLQNMQEVNPALRAVFYQLVQVLRFLHLSDLLAVYQGLEQNVGRFGQDENEVLLSLKQMGRLNHKLIARHLDSLLPPQEP